MYTRADLASQIREAQTPAEELRFLIGRLEAEIGMLGVPGGTNGQDRPVEILTMLDRASELLESLTALGTSLQAEHGRFDTITQQFRKKGRAFVRRVGGPEALRELRMARTVPEANWWWLTDERLAEEQKAQRRRTLSTAGIVSLAIALLSGLYALFLAPDKATRERTLHEQRAESYLTAGDLTAALSETEQALIYAPDDPALEVTHGVALELLGRHLEADNAFAQAEQAFDGNPELGGREGFYTTRAQAYLMANAAERSLADAQKIVALNPDSAVGYFQMGNANATLGNVAEASQNYQKAGALASASGDTQIEAMARIQLANMVMVVSGPQGGAPTPTP